MSWTITEGGDLYDFKNLTRVYSEHINKYIEYFVIIGPICIFHHKNG